jgi:catechol 2,3-dioxygenase
MEELFSHLAEDDSLDAPMPGGTKMGHVHLHVADTSDALRFYHELMGFDVMGDVPSVAFVSAGGYHHHLGLNTWAGAGALPPPPGSAGLRYFTIELPTGDDLQAVAGRLDSGGVRLQEREDALEAVDPSSNVVQLKVAPADSPAETAG